MKTKLQPWLMALTCLLMAGSALANTVIVTSTKDDGSSGTLRWAIPNTGNNGTIIFDPGLTGGTITLTNGELEIGRNLNIVGPVAGGVIVSGNHHSRVFNISTNAISPNTTVTISGLKISDGLAKGADGTSGHPDGAPGQGGGIINYGTLTLSNCTVTGNTALGGAYHFSGGKGGDGLGGGTYSSGTLTLVNCALSFNSATGAVGESDSGGAGSGGAIYLTAGWLVNCTIASNSATGGEGLPSSAGSGGGIYVASTNVTFISCTISGNNSVGADGNANGPNGNAGGAGWGGGIYVDGAAAPTLKNTIVSGNSVVGGLGSGGYPNGSTNGPDVFGPVISGGFNLIGESDDSSGWITSGTGMDQRGVIGAALLPNLGPLKNNGGPTPTMALSPDSVATDAGTNFGTTTDQRGQPRPFHYNSNQSYPAGGDGSDIGAFELYPGRPLLTITMVKASTTASHVKVRWPADGQGPGASGSGHAFGMQYAASLNVGTTWKGYKAPVKLMVNNEIVATDPVGDGPVNYRLTDDTNGFNLIFQTVTLPASNILTTSASLNGTTIPSDTNTVYWFEWGTDTNYYGGTNLPASLDTSTNPAPVSCAISALSPSTLYHFQLLVNDADGTQLGGDQTFTTADPVPVVNTLAPTSITTNSAQLNGNVNPDGPGADNAYFEYGPDTDHLTQSTLFFPSGNFFHAYSFNVTGLTPNTTYVYRFAAYNNTQAAYGAFSNFTTAAVVVQPPPIVTTQAASSVTTNSATLNGHVDPNGDSSTTAYIEWGFTTGYGNRTATNNIPTAQNVSASITGLSSFTTYHYRVDAVNSGGTSQGVDTNFTTAWFPVPPTLVSPGTTNDTGFNVNISPPPTFTWTGASQATSFSLIIRKLSDNSIAYQTNGLTGTSFQIPGGSLTVGTGGTKYSWTMTSFNNLGNQSAASTAFIFTAL